MKNEVQNELTRNYHQVALYRLEEGMSAKVYTLKKAYHRRNIFSHIQREFPKDDPLDLLEIGPGMGCLADTVLHAYPHVNYTVLDNNQGTLDEVRSRFPGISTHRVEEITGLSSVDGKFDVIAAIDVWEHLPPDDLTGYTRWCYDALKPGGMLILQFPNWGCPLTASTFCSDMTHVNQLNEKTVQQLFALVGIPEENYRLFNRRTPGVLGALRDGLMELYGVYLKMLHILFGTVRLKLFAPDLVTVVRKS